MKRIRLASSHIIAAVALSVALIICGFSPGGPTTKPVENSTSKPAFDVDWDLSEGHEPARVDWPPSRAKSDVTDVDGKRSVRIKFDKDHVFTGESRHILCTKSENGLLVQEIEVDSSPESLDDASEHASRIAKEWNMAGADIATWKASAAKGDLSGYLASNKTLRNPSIEVEIMPAIQVNGPEKWHVIVELFWEQGEQAK
jgi:hypothetical protein